MSSIEIYSFKQNRPNGEIFYSRHLRPDFVYGMTDEEIKKEYTITKLTAREVKRYLGGDDE